MAIQRLYDAKHQVYGVRKVWPQLQHEGIAAPRPNTLWVADLTYVATASGFMYVAFVIDAFVRRTVGGA